MAVHLTPAPDWRVVFVTYCAYGQLYRFRVLQTVVERLSMHFARNEVPRHVSRFHDFAVHPEPGYHPRSNSIDGL